jgi:hypothetical protein
MLFCGPGGAALDPWARTVDAFIAEVQHWCKSMNYKNALTS